MEKATIIQIEQTVRLINHDVAMIKKHLAGSTAADPMSIHRKLNSIRYVCGELMEIIAPAPDLLGTLTEMNPALCPSREENA